MALSTDVASLTRQLKAIREHFQAFRETVVGNVKADRARLDAIEADLLTVHSQLQQLNQRTNQLDARVTALGG